MKPSDYEQLVAVFAKFPCEVCGEPSCCEVWDFDRHITPQSTRMPEELRPTTQHWFCAAHERESDIRDVYIGWIFQNK